MAALQAGRLSSRLKYRGAALVLTIENGEPDHWFMTPCSDRTAASPPRIALRSPIASRKSALGLP